MTERLLIQTAYHLWAEATSSDWNWVEADEVKDQLRCYRCGAMRRADVHDPNYGKHVYEPGVLVAI